MIFEAEAFSNKMAEEIKCWVLCGLSFVETLITSFKQFFNW